MKAGLCDVKNIVLVLSGKGGVGKSTVSMQLAIGLWKKGFSVGLLDIDFCGPSIPRMLGLEKKSIHSCPEGWLPVYADGAVQRFGVVSIGFLIDSADSAVIWRGPRKAGMVGSFLNSVCWGKLDYLIIDTPPGTSDEHLSVIEEIQVGSEGRQVGAVIVSTSQRVSLCDVRREIGLCTQMNLNIVGLVENMSGYRCPNCSHCTNIFSSGGGEALTKEKSIPFLGRIPLDTSLTVLCDNADEFASKATVNEHTLHLIDELSMRLPIGT